MDRGGEDQRVWPREKVAVPSLHERDRTARDWNHVVKDSSKLLQTYFGVSRESVVLVIGSRFGGAKLHTSEIHTASKANRGGVGRSHHYGGDQSKQQCVPHWTRVQLVLIGSDGSARTPPRTACHLQLRSSFFRP